MINNKKGELTTAQIATIILLLASFAIIMFVYWQFNWKGTVDKEACHNSVILKASTPSVADRKVLDLPLRCKSEKKCFISAKGQKCDKFGDSKDVAYEVVSTSQTADKIQLDLKTSIADTLYDCWWMMGEGKVDIFSRSFQWSSYTGSCVECASIDFSPELKNKVTSISGFYEFLRTAKIKNTEMKYSDFLSANAGENPVDTMFPQKDLEGISTSKAYSILFVQYSRTTAPEDISSGVGAIIGAFVPDIVKKVFGGVGKVVVGVAEFVVGADRLRTITGIVGLSSGRGVGSAIGGLIGENFISIWMIVPSQATDVSRKPVSDILDINSLAKFGASPDAKEYCFAMTKYQKDSEGHPEWYALKKDSSSLYQYKFSEYNDDITLSKGKWEEIKIEGTEDMSYTVESIYIQDEFESLNKLFTFERDSNNANLFRINENDDDSYFYEGEIFPDGSLGNLYKYTNKLDEQGYNREDGFWEGIIDPKEIIDINTVPEVVQRTKADYLRQISSDLYSQCYGLSNIQCTWESVV